MRDVGSYRRRLRHASCKYGAQFGRRVAGSTSAGIIPDRESDSHWRTSRSCGQRGAENPSIVGTTNIDNASNDAGNAYAIWCIASECTSMLWIPWIPRWTYQLLRPRRTRCAMQRKLSRRPWWMCQQWSNTLLLYPWNFCPSGQRLHDTSRKAQEDPGRRTQ